MKWASKLFGGKGNNQDKILLKTIIIQTKQNGAENIIFDLNLEVCLIHLCPVKTTTLWA